MGSNKIAPLRALALAALLSMPPPAHAQSSPPRATGPTAPPPAPATPPGAPAAAATEQSDDVRLAAGVSLYDAGKPAECVAAFRDLLDPASPRALRDARMLEQARIYFFACLIEVGHTAEADEAIRAAIRANPLMKAPDAVVFQKVVVEEFLKVRDTLLDEIQRAERERLEKAQRLALAREAKTAAERTRLQRLEKLAATESIVHENRRWLAAVPFGVGQFQNRQDALGWTFFGTEVALAGVALGAMLVELNLYAQAPDAKSTAASDELTTKLHRAQTTLIVSSYAWLGVAALGIAHAELSFVPQFREQRPRTLPRELRAERARLAPTFGAGPKGAQIGVRGVF